MEKKDLPGMENQVGTCTGQPERIETNTSDSYLRQYERD